VRPLSTSANIGASVSWLALAAGVRRRESEEREEGDERRSDRRHAEERQNIFSFLSSTWKKK